jgi:hypothetical protein
MNIPPGDQQTYVAHHYSNLRRSVAQETFVKEEDARKRTVYCGDDGRLYGVVFNVAVGQNYRQSICRYQYAKCPNMRTRILICVLGLPGSSTHIRTGPLS